MPKKNLQNRVVPDGTIIKNPAYGAFMGNRGGKIHTPNQELGKRRWASKQWISCVLKFKERNRTVMGDSYTELFFMDEVTALAAGHRPCFECRRRAATDFAAAWVKGACLSQKLRAPEMDKILHDYRTNNNDINKISDVPDYTIIKKDDTFWMKKADFLHEWTITGYTKKDQYSPNETAEIITPLPIRWALAGGYIPQINESIHR